MNDIEMLDNTETAINQALGLLSATDFYSQYTIAMIVSGTVGCHMDYAYKLLQIILKEATGQA